MHWCKHENSLLSSWQQFDNNWETFYIPCCRHWVHCSLKIFVKIFACHIFELPPNYIKSIQSTFVHWRLLLQRLDVAPRHGRQEQDRGETWGEGGVWGSWWRRAWGGEGGGDQQGGEGTVYQVSHSKPGSTCERGGGWEIDCCREWKEHCTWKSINANSKNSWTIHFGGLNLNKKQLEPISAG